MEFFAFLVILSLLTISALVVVRMRYRRYTMLELILKVRMLSSHGSAIVWADCFGDSVSSTWLPISDVRKCNADLIVYTALADKCRREMAADSDEVDRAEMAFMHKAFLRKRAAILKEGALVIVEACFGKIARGRCCVHMAAIAQHFAGASMMVIDMLELVDRGSAELLESRILHGS